MTAVQRRCVQGLSKIQNPSRMVTRWCGPSDPYRPSSSFGEPIQNVPGGTQRKRWTTSSISNLNRDRTDGHSPKPTPRPAGCRFRGDAARFGNRPRRRHAAASGRNGDRRAFARIRDGLLARRSSRIIRRRSKRRTGRRSVQEGAIRLRRELGEAAANVVVPVRRIVVLRYAAHVPRVVVPRAAPDHTIGGRYDQHPTDD